MSIKIKQLPETERPYEKLELYGETVLSNAELLAIILKTGTKQKSSVELAQEILNLNDTSVDDLNFLKNMTIEEFTQVKGIGKVKAIQLKAFIELASRMSRPSNYKKVVIKEPKDLANILMGQLRNEKREIAKLVILNNKNEILKIDDIALGGTNFANIEIKDIISEPLKMKAPKIILVHNHPTGDSLPSRGDIEFTEKLINITSILGIELVDHIVIGNMEYTSIFSQMIQ